MKYMRFLNKTHNSNHRRCGPLHYKAPARLFYRVVRGMVSSKKASIANALQRLKCFEGVPYPYYKEKRVIVPDALKVLRGAPGRKIVKLGLLCSSVGWKYGETVKEFEKKRISNAYAKKS